MGLLPSYANRHSCHMLPFKMPRMVITDRVILDRPLQDMIGQFEHAIGVVERIDKDSSQLAKALAGEQARIIVTTLQKFPFVFDYIVSLPERTHAVIVDEAHSSQTGEAAKKLRRAHPLIASNSNARGKYLYRRSVQRAPTRNQGHRLRLGSCEKLNNNSRCRCLVSVVRRASPSQGLAANVYAVKITRPGKNLPVGCEESVATEQGCRHNEPVCGVSVEALAFQSDGPYRLRTMQGQFS